MGCIDKLAYTGLTCVLSYQVWYNLTGAMELGGKYLDTKELLYSVGSLLPAIFLAIHACKFAFAKTDEARKTLASCTSSKVICYFYMALFAGMLAFRVYIRFQFKN